MKVPCSIDLFNIQLVFQFDVQLWREDGRCGENFPLFNGESGQCDPHGSAPCCSNEGWCGSTEEHCQCTSCVNFRKVGKSATTNQVMNRKKRSSNDMLKKSKVNRMKRPSSRKSLPSTYMSKQAIFRGRSRMQNQTPSKTLFGYQTWTSRQNQSTRDTVHVNAAHGSTDITCGSIKTPCKSLKQAVQICKDGGRVIVQGELVATSEIDINKDILISGGRGAKIKGSTTVGFVFKIPTAIKVSIFEIAFYNTAIVAIDSSVTLRIANCSVIHDHAPTQWRSIAKRSYRSYGRIREYRRYNSLIRLDTNARGTMLSFMNSAFFSLKDVPVLYTSEIRSLHQSSIVFNKCAFAENSDIDLGKVKNISLFVTNCSFNGSRISIRRGDGLNEWTIIDSTFSNVTRGAIQIDDKHSTVMIIGTRFSNCAPNKQKVKMGWTAMPVEESGAISISGRRMSGGTSSVLIRSCSFEGNINRNNGGDINVRFITVARIEDSNFSKSRTENENIGENYGNGGSIAIFWTNITVANCTFINCKAKGKGGAILILDRVREPSEHSTSMDSSPPVSKIHAVFRNCTFNGNQAEKGGGAIVVETGGSIWIDSSTFIGNSGYLGGAIVYRLFEKDKLNIQSLLANSSFINNRAIASGGGVFVERVEKFWKQRALPSMPWEEEEPYSVVIENCVFANNSGLLTGQSLHAVDHIQLTDTLISSYERFNKVHLYLENGDIELSNLTVDLFRDPRFPLPGYSPSVELNSKEIRISRGFTLTCPTNFDVNTVNKTQDKTLPSFTSGNRIEKRTVYNYLSIGCRACPFSSYSLHSGNFYAERFPSTKTEKGVAISKDTIPVVHIQQIKCSSCPTGAICDVDVKAVDNYWGYIDTSFQLSFQQCPRGYCCSADTVPCVSYNTCAVGREGTLCGTCSKGYKQNFVGSDCIPKGGTCNERLFAIYVVTYTLGYTLVFILITNIKEIFSRAKTVLLKRNLPVQDKDKNIRDDDLSIAAFIQITILFYQVASLLQMKFHGFKEQKETSSREGLRESITNVFNFRFVVYEQVCPFGNLTLPQKEIILFEMKRSTILILLVVLFIYKVIKSLSFCYNSPTLSNDTPNGQSLELMPSTTNAACSDGTPNTSKLSFSCMLKFTVIKLLKLYYTPVTKSALMMVHCVTVRGESHLYVYGDLVCYSGWQMGMLIIVLPCIILFPLCFELSLKLLKDRQIASSYFILASCCPFYAIILYIYKLKYSQHEGDHYSEKEEYFRRTILDAEEMLFKEKVGISLGWQVVQLYRTLVISLLKIFVTNPVYQQLGYMVLLSGFLFHDRGRQPYKNKYLNHLQSLSSMCLINVLACNVIAAISYLVNVRTVPYITDVVKVLGYVELLVYAVVPLSLPMWKLKDFILSKRNARGNQE